MEEPDLASRVFRWICVLIASVGIFASLTFAFTGVPLQDWLRKANFKKAYSGQNLTYSRGATALKVGDVATATTELLTIPPKSTEAEDLSYALFPLLLEKPDFDRAAKVARHMKPAELNANTSKSALLGAQLGETLGLSSGMDFVKRNPDAAVLRRELLPTLFTAVAPKELKSLEGIVDRLPKEDREGAIDAIVVQQSALENYARAWSWSVRLARQQRYKRQVEILGRWPNRDLKKCVEIIEQAPEIKEFNPARMSIASSLQGIDRERALRIVAKMVPGTLKTYTLKTLVPITSEPIWKINLKKARSQKTPQKKAGALLSVALDNIGEKPRIREILADLRTLSEKSPEIRKQHDGLVRVLAVACFLKSDQMKFAGEMLDATERISLEREIARGGPDRAKLAVPGRTMLIRREGIGITMTEDMPQAN